MAGIVYRATEFRRMRCQCDFTKMLELLNCSLELEDCVVPFSRPFGDVIEVGCIVILARIIAEDHPGEVSHSARLAGNARLFRLTFL